MSLALSLASLELELEVSLTLPYFFYSSLWYFYCFLVNMVMYSISTSFRMLVMHTHMALSTSWLLSVFKKFCCSGVNSGFSSSKALIFLVFFFVNFLLSAICTEERVVVFQRPSFLYRIDYLIELCKILPSNDFSSDSFKTCTLY